MKKQVYRQIGRFLCLAMVVLLCAGCGGEYDDFSGKSGISDGAVSASAVSGQAVSVSAVSGQAVSGKEKKEKHLYSNDTNVYYIEDGEGDEDWQTTLVERNLNTGTEKKIKMGDNEDRELGLLLFVDNDWIYYYMYEEEAEVFYRAPMEKRGGSLHVNLEKKEKLYAEQHGVFGTDMNDYGPFCNGKWIAYVTAGGKFCRYDISRKESLSPIGDIAVMGDQNGTEGVIVDLGHDKGEEYEWEKNWLDGDSGKLVRVSEMEEETYYRKEVSVDGIGVFFADAYSYDEEDEPEEKMDMCLWHTPDSAHPEGWVEMITKGEEIRSLLKGREDIDEKAYFETVSVFVRNDTVYQQISAEWEKGKVTYRNMIVLSRSLGGDSELKVEKELSRVLKNPKENQKKFMKIWPRARSASEAFFFSRGLCVEMTEEYAFFILSEKEEWRTALYEFESGKLRFIDEKDSEWSLLQRDTHLFQSEMVGYMPDNGGDDDLEG